MSLEPPIIVDAAYVDRLHGLALAALRRNPEVGERLLEEVERAQIVPSAAMPSCVVNIGSRLTYRDEIADEIHTVTLVFPSEANIADGRISVLTPVGAALVGLHEGASIDWQTRNGDHKILTVIGVVKPPTDPVSRMD